MIPKIDPTSLFIAALVFRDLGSSMEFVSRLKKEKEEN